MVHEIEKNIGVEKELPEKPLFGVLAHGYQPPRIFNVELTLEGKPYDAGFSVFPEVNDNIAGQVYKPILGEVEQLPSGLITSIYASLRSYLRKYKPDLFANIQRAVGNTVDKEYCVLGDPLVHVILPLLPPEDQQMLLKAGKFAFYKDFGFFPKGLWLPETAVTKEVLHSAFMVGYEFVPLRDSQVIGKVNFDAKHNICLVRTNEGGEIAVLLGNSELSGYVSYSPWSTYNAENFMKERQEKEQKNGQNALMMMDLERFGHHQIGAEKFLKRTLSIQEKYGFSPLNMRQVIEKFQQGEEKTYVEIIDGSSWSCSHNFGRWTGECNCDNPSELALEIKKEFYSNLIEMNKFINASLDKISFLWREEFIILFVALSDDIFAGVNFGPKLLAMVKNMGESEGTAKLYLAKIEVMIGLTSCGWFFGGDDRPERNIPNSMIKGVGELFPECF